MRLNYLPCISPDTQICEQTPKQEKLDFGFLRELGEICTNSRFRIVCGVQEQLFDNPNFSFVSDTLNKVHKRFEQMIIQKQDTAYVVSERILKKNDEQKAWIRQHLQKFCSLYSNMAENLEQYNVFSVSLVGSALMFTIGQIAQSDKSEPDPLFAAGLHDYLVVYGDCSASCRILLFANGTGNQVDISVAPIVTEVFKSIYKLLCGDDFHKIFVHAQKYESLKVLKQFVPVYEMSRHFGELENNPFKDVLKNHRAKYGENLIVQSNRVPVFGYELIDKQWFDKFKIKYNQENLIEELFGSSYTHLGYVDPFKTGKEQVGEVD